METNRIPEATGKQHLTENKANTFRFPQEYYLYSGTLGAIEGLGAPRSRDAQSG